MSEIKQGIYFDVSNADYHAGDGVSKSQLDMVAKTPALLKWIKSAPQDTEGITALNMGSALHCRLLEPDEFNKRFVVAPKFNRRTNQGKEDEKAFLSERASEGITVIEADEGRKLDLMCGSALAHPAARWILEQPGHCEASMFWNDGETGELCRIRPDKWLNEHNVIVDVKTVADVEDFSRHIERFRYHVQDAMYREGAFRVTGHQHGFFFIAISKTLDCGRYPVRVFELDSADVDTGHKLFRRDLNTWHECRTNDEWGGVEVIKRPEWAHKQDMYL